MFSHPQLENWTSSSSTLDLLHKWFLSCRDDHASCDNLISKAWNPTRLLDIGVNGDVNWRLCLSEEEKLPPLDYMTLSYRWSSNPSLLLLSSKLKEFCREKPIQDLPQTFKDAIAIARYFSIRYLWIDSLCIIQDSQEDWLKEAKAMSSVYARSSCNISASASAGPEGGLFRKRDPEAIRPRFVRAAFSTPKSQDYWIFDKNYMERQLLDGPLHRRGWVFQERLLAPRVLHFASGQVFWECFTENKCEAFPRGLPLSFPLKNFNALWDTPKPSKDQRNVLSVRAFQLWNNLVSEYTKCRLTRPTDKLIAFAGLAELFRETTGDQYVSGLWRSRLIEHLDWCVYQPVPRPCSEYIAPSWSWASVDGEVYIRGINALTKTHVSILDVQEQSSYDRDGITHTEKGHIKINATAVDCTCRSTEDLGLFILESENYSTKVQIYFDVLEDFSDKKVRCVILKTDPLYTRTPGKPPIIFSVIFLVLESHEEAVLNTYTRIGQFILRETEQVEEFGICISEDGSVVSAKDGKSSTFILI